MGVEISNLKCAVWDIDVDGDIPIARAGTDTDYSHSGLLGLLPPATWVHFYRASYFISVLGVIDRPKPD